MMSQVLSRGKASPWRERPSNHDALEGAEAWLSRLAWPALVALCVYLLWELHTDVLASGVFFLLLVFAVACSINAWTSSRVTGRD